MNYDFGERLRALRKEKDITQAEMAELVGLSPRFYQDVEQGRKDPSFKKFQEILNRLKMTYAEFFGETEAGGTQTVVSITPDELVERIAAASKRDDLEVARLKKENEDLKKIIRSIDQRVYPGWQESEKLAQVLAIFYLTGNVDDLRKDLPAAIREKYGDLSQHLQQKRVQEVQKGILKSHQVVGLTARSPKSPA